MTKQESIINCPLCAHDGETFHRDRVRNYLRCPRCDLVFVPGKYHLPPEKEKARYDFHQNDPDDKNYRAFLARLAEPVKTKLAPGARGLDFGCGPAPTLSVMFEEADYTCAVYDLYYAPDQSVFETQYDFLTCSETMEHLGRPHEEFERFLQLVKPGGWIGIMTQLYDKAPVPFKGWHYKDDDTHVGFYSRMTFEFLADTYSLRLEFHPDSVILLQTT
jgi:SAM-dependent methyltransferase